jgi:hypothetical protein
MAQTPLFCRQLRGRPTSATSSKTCAECCAFEDPGCVGCPDRPDEARALIGVNDPFKSSVTNGWLHGELHAPN